MHRAALLSQQTVNRLQTFGVQSVKGSVMGSLQMLLTEETANQVSQPARALFLPLLA